MKIAIEQFSVCFTEAETKLKNRITSSDEICYILDNGLGFTYVFFANQLISKDEVLLIKIYQPVSITVSL